MIITVSFKILPLKDGGFRPDFHLLEWSGDKAMIMEYNTSDAAFATVDEAKKAAKHYALQTIKEKYGNDVQINFS